MMSYMLMSGNRNRKQPTHPNFFYHILTWKLASPGDWMENDIIPNLSVVQLIELVYQLELRLYDVEYLDDTIKVLAANVIADNIFSQVNEEGHKQLMIIEIFDHRRNSEPKLHDDALYSTKNGNNCRKRTTKGWELGMQCKDGS